MVIIEQPGKEKIVINNMKPMSSSNYAIYEMKRSSFGELKRIT